MTLETIDQMRERQEVLARMSRRPDMSVEDFTAVKSEWLAIQRQLVTLLRMRRAQ